LETFREIHQGKFSDVPKLVAELSVTYNSLNIQINALLDHVAHDAESKRISTAFRDSLWEIFCLISDGFFDLTWWQV